MQSEVNTSKELSCLSLSIDQFAAHYSNIQGKSEAKTLYLLVLSEMGKSVSDGNVKTFNTLFNFIECINIAENSNTLLDFFNDVNNPVRNTNLVILTCKYNKIKILEKIFHNFQILKYISCGTVAPDDFDEECHNSFYYAIRSGNVKLLKMLINRWPEKYFDAHVTELDEILSNAYEELKLKNVLLSNEMELFVENKLINLRFFSNSSHVPTVDLHRLEERVQLVLENITLLIEEYYSNTKEIDERFMYIAKFIGQNIHILKRLLKSTHDKLPWEEIEFCLVCFVSCHMKQKEINLFSRAILNKCRILDHLKIFSKNLKYVFEGIHSFKQINTSKLKREEAIELIIKNDPQFEDLYNDYQQIRDVHSLDTINNYINLASTVDLQNKESRIIIARVLQVIGEYLKNTLESPKLSQNTSELLLLSLPKNTRVIIMNLRNSLSHAQSLLKRIDIENNVNTNFFIGVQNDLEKIGGVISSILYRKKIKTITILLKKIISLKSFDEMNEVLKIMNTVNLDIMNSTNFIANYEHLEELILKLSKSITEKAPDKQKLFDEIISKIHSSKNKVKDVKFNYFMALCFLKGLNNYNDIKIDDNIISGFKFRANHTLKNLSLEIESDSLKEINILLSDIFRSFRSETHNNSEEVYKFILEFYSIADLDMKHIKWIEELREKLNDKSFIFSSSEKVIAMQPEEKYHKQLKLKLQELKIILQNLSDNPVTVRNISCFKSNKKLQSVVEMLVLDIMSILDSFKKCRLETNLYFLDDAIPLLIGKSLRNHLAHNNAIVDILLFDPLVILFLNANKLIAENIYECDKKIGKFVTDNPLQLKVKYSQRLFTVTNQKNMFVALENGNISDFESCLKEGADINARNFSSWTALHFAAKGNCLAVIKCITERNLDVNVKNDTGQNPLHVAAEYGRRLIVEFLVKEAFMSVDDVDSRGKTPLHFAAKNGHKDSVEFLLKHNANTLTKDKVGLSPIHYAIRNGHIDVVKALLDKDKSVDLNESMGGYTPLHEAAERGHEELVNFLIQNGANANAKTDKNWTPLHAAAFNGYLKVVNTLILGGAEVNARIIDGCTPLHYAAENGHEKIAEVLLKNKAYVDVFDNVYNSGPLHLAARGGYEKLAIMLLKYKANANVATVECMTPLHIAAEEGHVQIVVALLEHGVDIDTRNKYLCTPLHSASANGHSAVVKILIENKALITARNINHSTPLHLAAFMNHLEVADILIRNNAEISAKSIIGQSPLHFAAINCSINVIDLLIRNKVDVNTRDSLGFTPLHSAVLNGQKQAVDFLIKNGARVNTKAVINDYPLHTAAFYGYKDIMDILIKHKAEINVKNNNDSTPLHVAANAGFKEAVEILVTNGANVNAINKSKMTPLLSAVNNNHNNIVEYLILNEAVINYEALSIAVCAGYIGTVKTLLKNGAEINNYDPENVTLLHLASFRGYAEIVKSLIMGGCAVDATAINNITSLYMAATEGYEEVVQILISNGANANFKCSEGFTPLHIAATNGHINVVKVLLNNNVDINVKDYKNRLPLELAVARGHLQVVKYLTQSVVNINAKGNDDWTVLHIASQQNNLEIIKYLINEGCDIKAETASGAKPVHIAAREGFKDSVAFFLSKGSSVNDVGAYNQTLLYYAIMKGHLDIIKYLIIQGADVNVKDINGMTPLHFAAKFGYRDILEVLLANGAIYNIFNIFNQKPLDVTENKDIVMLLSSTEKLFVAVKHNSQTQVEDYIKTGAFVNARNADCGTPLHYASWKGGFEIVNILLQNKSDANAIGKNGCTPLHYAAKFSHVNVVETLLCYGAIYNAVSGNGKIPLDFATDEQITALLKLVYKSFKSIENGSCEVIKDLKNVKDLHTIKAIMNAHNRDNRTLIVAAIHVNFSKVEQLKEILQDGVSSKVGTALFLTSKGNYEKALSIFENVFEKRKDILGLDNPGTLDIQSHIATILYKQGMYHKALNIFEEILQKQKQHLGYNYKDTLYTRSKIALVLYRLDRNEEALKIFQEVYELQKDVLGPNHEDTLETNFHMALVLDKLGKFEEALSINQKTYEIMKGANDPAAIHAQNNIAMVLSNQGKYEEALKVYYEVLEQKKLLLGMTHTDTLRTLQHIAMLLQKQKKYPDALKAYEEISNMHKNILGANHPETLNSQYDFANLLFDQGKLITAFKLFKEISYRRESIWGQNNPSVLVISAKIEVIKLKFKYDGYKESDFLQWLQTDMNIAANNGNIQFVEYMLQNGADVNDKDADGRTPLHFAVNNGHINVVTTLLKNGADVTRVTHKGNTPLHTAALKGDKDIVRNLLEHVIENKSNFINAQTIVGGNTALHVASKIGSLDIVLSLLKHFAKYNVQNKENKTPCDLSTDLNIISIFKLVDELFQDAKNGHERIIKKLKAVPRDEFLSVTHARNNQEKTLLQVMIGNKHKSIAAELLKMLKNTDKNT